MSATGYLDACGFIPASSGTGSFVVSSAITGYQTPASAGAVNSTVYSYRAESSDKSQWEEGFGAYTVSTTTLARSTITANSSGGTSAINFSAAPNVFITAMSADLQNAALLTSGTLPVARLNGGSANQFVQGDGTFQTQSRKLLNTLTASSSATLSDTISLTSAFSVYEIEFINLIPATTSVTLELQVHSSSAFQSGSYLSSTIAANGSALASQAFTNCVGLSQSGAVPNSAPGVSGSIRVYSPSGTTAAKMWNGLVSYRLASGMEPVVVSGMWNSTGAVDGFQILFSSGNIASGTVKVYGLN